MIFFKLLLGGLNAGHSAYLVITLYEIMRRVHGYWLKSGGVDFVGRARIYSPHQRP